MIFLTPIVALSAPSKKDKEEISAIVERSSQTLGGLIECDRLDLSGEYVTVLHDAMNTYPGTDPTKVRALMRKIETQAQSISRFGIKSIPSPTLEDLERQKVICESQIPRAKRDIRTLNDFILK